MTAPGMRPPWDSLREILTAGLQAPSADNAHRLHFRADADSVALLATDHASWAALPHQRLLAMLAHAAVVENIALRSAERGLTLTTEWHADAARSDLVATMRWRPSDPAQAVDPLGAAIAARHTNRRFYRRAAVDASTLAALQTAAADGGRAELRWLDAPPWRSTALAAIRLAETERFRRPALHAELFDAIRFDLGWHRTADESLPPAALEVEAPARPVFSAMRHWPRMRAANLVGAHLGFGWRAGYLPCALSPHLGLVLADGRDPDDAARRAGRAFQRAWLAAAAADLALQPMAAATVLTRQIPGNGWVSQATQQRLRELLDRLRGDSPGEPFMLFRLGRAGPPSVVTGRKPLHGYVT